MDEYYIKEILPDGSFIFTRTDLKPVENDLYNSSKTPARSPAKVIEEDKYTLPIAMSYPQMSSKSPRFQMTSQVSQSPSRMTSQVSQSPSRMTSQSPSRMTSQSPSRMTSQSPSRMTSQVSQSPSRMTSQVSQSPSRMTSKSPRFQMTSQPSYISSPSRIIPQVSQYSVNDYEDEYLNEEIDLLAIPDNENIYNPFILSIKKENIISFYVELYDQNMYGVVVQDEEAADSLIRSIGGFKKQMDTPRAIHYIQLALQSDSSLYWGSNSPLIKIDMSDPLRGKITYIVVQKDSKYFAIVILIN